MSSTFQRHRWEGGNEKMTETPGSVEGQDPLSRMAEKGMVFPLFFSDFMHSLVSKVGVQHKWPEGERLCFHKDQKFVLHELCSVLMSWSRASMKREMTSLPSPMSHPPSPSEDSPCVHLPLALHLDDRRCEWLQGQAAIAAETGSPRQARRESSVRARPPVLTRCLAW